MPPSSSGVNALRCGPKGAGAVGAESALQSLQRQGIIDVNGFRGAFLHSSKSGVSSLREIVSSG
jgi:hypothetical protein